MIVARFSGTMGNFTLDANFQVPGTGVTALFGPSGSGKTTVLRCIAGLLRLSGQLTVNGQSWQSARNFRPVHRRPIAYVFQEPSLFPHLSVQGNLAFGQRRTKANKRNQAGAIAFDDVVDLLGILPLLDRHISRLSGGERQRVAIGRALLSQPELILMDEPLSALDQLSKDGILPYLERLNASLAIPMIYVSHDLSEVERLADTIVLMDAGKVQAVGSLDTMVADASLPLLHRSDPTAILHGKIIKYDPNYCLSEVDVPGARLLIPGELGQIGAACRIRVPASDVSLGRTKPEETSVLNTPSARVLSGVPIGKDQITVRLALGTDGQGALVMSRISRLSWDRLQLQPGETVVLRLKAVALKDRLNDGPSDHLTMNSA